MEDENAFTPTLCIAQIAHDRWSNTRLRFQVKEDQNVGDLIACCEFYSFLVEVQTIAGYIHAMHEMHV